VDVDAARERRRRERGVRGDGDERSEEVGTLRVEVRLQTGNISGAGIRAGTTGSVSVVGCANPTVCAVRAVRARRRAPCTSPRWAHQGAAAGGAHSAPRAHGVRREQRHPPARCGAVRQLLCAPARIHRQKVRRERLGRRVRVRVRVRSGATHTARECGSAGGTGAVVRASAAIILPAGGESARGTQRNAKTQRNATQPLGPMKDVREGHACELGACRGERCGRDGL